VDEIGNQELAVSVENASKHAIEFTNQDLMRKTLNVDKNEGIVTPKMEHHIMENHHKTAQISIDSEAFHQNKKQ
jgi:hypothetical protein